jgi:glyoxylate/hydroxypyruvate reductase
MSIAIVFNNKDPKPWQTKLQEKLPETSVEIYPNIANAEAVTFALVWKAEPNVLSAFPNLQVAQSVGASVDHITTTQKLNNSVQIARIIDHNLNNDMWEFLLAIVSSSLKNLRAYQFQQTNQQWQAIPYKSFKETSITILGLGQIGSYVARQFTQLGFQVKGWSNSPKNIDHVQSFHGKEQLLTACKQSDFLINILPKTPETEGIINNELLNQLAQGATLVNVGRGEHLVENDLLQALENKQIYHAYLDVFATEPLPSVHPFWQHNSISITPHIASITNVDSASDLIVKNYLLSVQGKVLPNTLETGKAY